MRRLDAALVRGGLTPLSCPGLKNRINQARYRGGEFAATSTGVKPPDTKAASSRRTPK